MNIKLNKNHHSPFINTRMNTSQHLNLGSIACIVLRTRDKGWVKLWIHSNL